MDVLVVLLAHELGEIVEQGFGNRRRGGDEPHVSLDAPVERSDVRADAFGTEQHVARVLEQCDARRRRLDSAPPAHEELRAELTLQLGDALADRRRLDVFLFGGDLDVRAIADGDEQPEGFEIEVLHGASRWRRGVPDRNPMRPKIPLPTTAGNF